MPLLDAELEPHTAGLILGGELMVGRHFLSFLFNFLVSVRTLSMWTCIIFTPFMLRIM